MTKTKTSVKKKTTAKKGVLSKSKKSSLKVAKKKSEGSPKKLTKPVKSLKKDIKKAVVKKEKSVNIPAAAKTEVIEKKIKKYKPNKKVRYTKSELKHFREIILHERKAIFESAKANMDALVDKDGEYKGDNLTYSSHMAEQGTDEMEREKNYLFVQRDEKYLGYLQDALMRIDQGTYGICIDCRDEPKNLCKTCPLIIKERLELVPITQHCIECKNLIRG